MSTKLKDMDFNVLIQNALATIKAISKEDALQAPKTWFSHPHDQVWAVLDLELYYTLIEQIFSSDDFIYKNYSRKTAFKFIDKQLIKAKKSNTNKFEKKSFFKSLAEAEKHNFKVFTPISGVRLDSSSDFKLGAFHFSYSENFEFDFSDTRYLNIGITTSDIYDTQIAIQKSTNAFTDFIRLVHFILGRFDNQHLIKFGLPLYPQMSNEKMYTETNKFLFIDEKDIQHSSTINNDFKEIIPIDNDFFKKHDSLSFIWDLYKKNFNGEKISDIEKRLLNSSLAIGESARSNNVKNSVIYSCIALETLLSHNEGSLFRESIGEMLSKTLAFIVTDDPKERQEVAKLVKKIYSFRSALVHGGSQKITNKYVRLNVLIRSAISIIHNSNEYKDFKRIDQIYEHVRKLMFK